ncbi:MAG: hypothetical protein ABSA30_10855 [Candidatus Aminicenantales bacterium]|jgi:hypothetical protein
MERRFAVAFDDKSVLIRRPVDERMAGEIYSRSSGTLLTCSAAIAAAERLGTDPLEIGRAADVMGIRLTACQLGFFGFPGRAKGWAGVAGRPGPPGFEDAVRSVRSEGGSISCADLWNVAERFSVPRILAGYIADRLGIDVRSCQLGAF